MHLYSKMTKSVTIGSLKIGGGAPISVQSMTNVATSNKNALFNQLLVLKEAGADFVRATVNDRAAVEGFAYVCAKRLLPLVADIHFDYRLAIQAVKAGASKIRINPGNIGSDKGVSEVCAACKDAGIPIRIGVNKGSLATDIIEKYGVSPTALVESALSEAARLEKYGFSDIVLSVKASDVKQTIEAYKMLSTRCQYPLHLGVTEAGGGSLALVKSAIGIGALLAQGIGDTIRVSLSDDPIKEVQAGVDILRSLKLRNDYVEVISCPTCGRTEYDVIGISERLREATKDIKKHITIAVMGCVVNGLGEGRDADIGIAGGREKSILMVKGERVGVIENDKVENALMDLLKNQL